MIIRQEERAERQLAPGGLPEERPGHGRKLRVVHVVSSLLVGGMEQFVLRIADEQRARGCEVTLIGLRGGPLVDPARALGLDVRVLGGRHTAPRVLRAAAQMARLRPHIAHAHNPNALPYALLARLSGSAGVVMTRHGQEPKRIGGRLHWHHTAAVVAVSEAAAAALRQRNPENAHKISVIRNGVQFSPVNQDRKTLRASLGLAEQECVGIIVARLDPVKAHDCLLQSLAMVKQRGLDTTMLIAGDGPERGDLERLATELGLGPDRLRFLGFRSDVGDLLNAADFFVLPSRTEGLPLSLLEAMACRLPVVVTPVGGIPEVITDGRHGILIPVDDPERLSQAIAELVSDPVRRASMGAAAYDHARAHFSFEAMLQEYEDLYRRIRGASHRP